MTRQHIRFSALRSIFWGTLLLFLDFDLNFRFGFSFTLPLLPQLYRLLAGGPRDPVSGRRPAQSGPAGPLLAGPGALVPSAVFPRPLPLISPARSPFWPLWSGCTPTFSCSPIWPVWRRTCSPARPSPAAAPVPTSCSGCGSSPGPWLPLRRQVDNPSSAQGKASREGQAPPPADCAAPSVMPQGAGSRPPRGRALCALHRKTRPWEGISSPGARLVFQNRLPVI